CLNLRLSVLSSMTRQKQNRTEQKAICRAKWPDRTEKPVTLRYVICLTARQLGTLRATQYTLVPKRTRPPDGGLRLGERALNAVGHPRGRAVSFPGCIARV